MRFDKLGRRLKWAAAVGGVALVAAAAATWPRGRRPRRRAACAAPLGDAAPPLGRTGGARTSPPALQWTVARGAVAVAGRVVRVARGSGPGTTPLAPHARPTEYEEQVAPGTSASTGLATVLPAARSIVR